MKMKHIGANIYMVYTDIQYPLSSAFFRLQEYYESRFKSIRGKFFTHEKLMDTSAYRDPSYEFSYFSDNAGFNVPDWAVKEFKEKFQHNFWDCEKRLFALLDEIPEGVPFYVIGVYDEATLIHEIAHGLYYLDNLYKIHMDMYSAGLPYFKAFSRILKERGYCRHVVMDEIQAYLTGHKSGLIECVGFKRNWKVPSFFKWFLNNHIVDFKIDTKVPEDGA